MTVSVFRYLLKSDLGQKIDFWAKYRDFTVFWVYPLYSHSTRDRPWKLEVGFFSAFLGVFAKIRGNWNRRQDSAPEGGKWVPKWFWGV